MSICSYYGTRESIPLAQIVTVPYSMLLSKDARETLGIVLEDNIVIFDEAHNIVDAINNTYKVEITSKQLVVARRTLWSYFSKYEKRFKGMNAFYIKQLLSILECLTKYLRQLSRSAGKAAVAGDGDDGVTGAQMLTINDFLFSAKIDHFNTFKILEYLSESGLAKKLMGFVESANAGASAPPRAAADDDEGFESRHISPLRIVEALLKALTSAGGDGRILAQPHNVRRSRGTNKRAQLLTVCWLGGCSWTAHQRRWRIDQVHPAEPCRSLPGDRQEVAECHSGWRNNATGKHHDARMPGSCALI
jgi:chromosome transmission fidelity protein 1